METHNRSALIIEDDEDICILLKQMLKGKNFTSQHTHTLEATQALLTHISPDVIFIDHRLPDGFGLEFVPTLRQSFPQALIIAMTAQHSVENRVMAYMNGVNYFLEKPFLVCQIYELIDTIPNT